MKKADAARDEMIRKYAESGISMKEAAANLGCRYQTVLLRARKLGVAFERGGRKKLPDRRAREMHSAYLSGRTLEQIGADFGVTQERVRQVITKYYGKIASEGGAAARVRINQEKRAAALDARAFAKWGCTRKQYVVLKRMTLTLIEQGVSRYRTPIGAFCRQRMTAKFRGVAWELSLWDWWTIWQKSGKWSRRGRGRGHFVMCRKDDIGPYSKDNVFIDLACRNISSATRKADLPVGVRIVGTRFEAYTVSKGRRVALGRFDTPQEAHIAYLRDLHVEREAA